MKTFLDYKRKQLKMKDASSIGYWDKRISKLCAKLNRNKNYYTTSSCAGRIVLIIADEKKKSGLFLFRSHEKINLQELKRELEKAKQTRKLIYFKQEPCILHVACKSLGDAQALLDRAKLAGWKNSGIMASGNRFVLEMRSTEKLEFPIINKGKILVDDNYLKLLVSEANKRLGRTWGKIEKMEKLI